jgi:hypothetical protein
MIAIVLVRGCSASSFRVPADHSAITRATGFEVCAAVNGRRQTETATRNFGQERTVREFAVLIGADPLGSGASGDWKSVTQCEQVAMSL